jgi:hypothetical protein
MRPVVFTSSWGLEGLGLIVVQVGGAASLFSLCCPNQLHLQRHCILILSSGVSFPGSKSAEMPRSPKSANFNVNVPLVLIRECRIIETEADDIAALESYVSPQAEDSSQKLEQKRRLCARVTWTDLSVDGGTCSVCMHPRQFDESIDFVREYIAAAIMHDAEESEKDDVFVLSRGGGRRKSPVAKDAVVPPTLARVEVAAVAPSLPPLLVNASDHGEQLVPVNSKLLVETDVLQLVRWLPPRFVDRSWRLVYTAGGASAKLHKKGASQKQDGFSIKSVYENMRSCRPNSPVISIIRDEKGYLFGVFSTEPWRESPKSFGCGETFVFKLQPDAEMFRWSHTGEDFLQCTKSYIAVGGGKAAALWLDDELNVGSSGECRSASIFDVGRFCVVWCILVCS